MSAFKKATKHTAKLRAALFGPSGSGKTYSALRIATGIGGKIAVVDTEHGSASKYADRFNFDVAEMNGDKSIDALCALLKDAAGYDVVIIDSLSHSWQELLEEIDQLAKSKYRGNTWSAWSDGTPKQRRLIEAILGCPAHVIATIRSKTAWEQEKDDRTGKMKPVRIGLAPEQGKGIEYEFDLLIEINTEHYAVVIKDRTGKFQDKTIKEPGESFGKALAEWLEDGTAKGPSREAKVKYLEGIQDKKPTVIDGLFVEHGIPEGTEIANLDDDQLEIIGLAWRYILDSKKKAAASIDVDY